MRASLETSLFPVGLEARTFFLDEDLAFPGGMVVVNWEDGDPEARTVEAVLTIGLASGQSCANLIQSCTEEPRGCEAVSRTFSRLPIADGALDMATYGASPVASALGGAIMVVRTPTWDSLFDDYAKLISGGTDGGSAAAKPTATPSLEETSSEVDCCKEEVCSQEIRPGLSEKYSSPHL